MRPVRTLLVAASLTWPISNLLPQGVTSSGIRGIVVAEGAVAVEGARVRVSDAATGYAVEVEARHARFLIQGLEPGGPYTVTVRRLGFVAQQREHIMLELGELLELDFVLRPVVAELEPVAVVAGDKSSYSPAYAHGGTVTTISESMLRDLPTLNRDLYEFLRLVPQISTKVGVANAGFSAGGVGFRFNNFLINGVSERSMAGNVSIAYLNAKSIPLDAVQEYQVLLAPYDVRYGDFAGALVNAITKSGTTPCAARSSPLGETTSSRDKRHRQEQPPTTGFNTVSRLAVPLCAIDCMFSSARSCSNSPIPRQAHTSDSRGMPIAPFLSAKRIWRDSKRSCELPVSLRAPPGRWKTGIRRETFSRVSTSRSRPGTVV
jgi:hypothetical protein